MASKTISGRKTVSGSKQQASGEVAAPSKAINFSPADGATWVAADALLSWANGGGALNYDVYFDTANPPTTQVVTAGSGLSYDPTLTYATTYRWRVNPKNSAGTTTGDVLSFTTVTPWTANSYTDFESGSNGDALSTTILDSTTVGSIGAWTIPVSNSMTIATSQAHRLPTPVTIGGSTYDNANASRTVKVDNSVTANFFRRTLSADQDDLTVALDITFGSNNYAPGANAQLDLVQLLATDGDFGVLQQYATGKIIAHTGAGGTHTDASQGNGIAIVVGKTYRANVRWVKNDKCYVALYDPDTRAQVGVTQSLALPNKQVHSLNFGRTDGHVGEPASFTYYSNIVVYYGANSGLGKI